MAIKTSPLDALDPGECVCQMDGGCCCGPAERALRIIQSGAAKLNTEQREWCLSEIDQIEGYSRKEHADDSDPDLASCVFSAWTDFCRDKGML